MGKIRIVLGASILLLSMQVNSAIISVDDSVFGTDSVTRDSVSGLDWLDITFTVNRSVADVSGQLGVGGEFEGWWYATGIEFEELLFNYTGVDSAPVYQTEEYTEGSDSIDELIKLLGDSVEAYNEFYGLPPSDELYCGKEPECIGRGYHETHGYLADETPPEYTQLFYTGIVRDLGEGHQANDYSLSHRIRIHQANQHPAVGSYLVRTTCSEFPGGGETEGCFPGPGPFPGGGVSAVPAPAAIWLFGTGLIGLIGFSKRRNQLAS